MPLPEKYEEGRCAAFDGLPQSANPYTPGTKDAKQWATGWADGMRELHGDDGDDADSPTIVEHRRTQLP